MSRETNQSFWGDAEKRRRSGPEQNPSTSFAEYAHQARPATRGAAAAVALGQPTIQALEQEKRRYPRFKCEGALELKTDGSTIRTWATFTDLSVAGCYVELMTTFPVGTKMQLQLGMNGFLVQGAAIVRATYPFLGMGIEFTELTDTAREQLQAMVASLTNAAMRKPASVQKKTQQVAEIPDPGAALAALAKYFESAQTLSAEDFPRVVANSQHPSR